MLTLVATQKMGTKVRVLDQNFKFAMFLHVLILNILFACIMKSYAETSHAYVSETNSKHGLESSDDHQGLEPSADCSEDDESCFLRDDEEHEEEIQDIAGSDSNTESGNNGYQWDKNGYIMFCPCMGRFGNQAEHYLGAMAFAKALDRTLVLPPFRTFAHASFGELFQVGPVHEFHRVILMEDFMKFLAPKYWPPSQRFGYAHLPVTDDVSCVMKIGNPFGPFWDHFNITFDKCIKYQLYNFADISDKHSMERTKAFWDERFPPMEHPVLALRGSPGSYPMLRGNREIQKHFKWEPKFFEEAGNYIKKTFHDEGFVGIHLRNGLDWVRACQHVEGNSLKRYMASPQCLDETPEAVVTKELCLPSVSHILQHTSAVFKHVNAKHLYIATDKHPNLEELRNFLQPIGVTVHYLKPSLVETDLMILGQADYFIGNCISSFSSFVKRERDANWKPSSFFGQDLKF